MAADLNSLPTLLRIVMVLFLQTTNVLALNLPYSVPHVPRHGTRPLTQTVICRKLPLHLRSHLSVFLPCIHVLHDRDVILLSSLVLKLPFPKHLKLPLTLPPYLLIHPAFDWSSTLQTFKSLDFSVFRKPLAFSVTSTAHPKPSISALVPYHPTF